MNQLTWDEGNEVSSLRYRLKNWIAYCERCREQAKQQKLRDKDSLIDYGRDLSNEEYYRLNELWWKLFGGK